MRRPTNTKSVSVHSLLLYWVQLVLEARDGAANDVVHVYPQNGDDAARAVALHPQAGVKSVWRPIQTTQGVSNMHEPSPRCVGLSVDWGR